MPRQCRIHCNDRSEELPLTDAGLKYVSSFSGLETLSLENTRVTDAGLRHLRGLRNLQRLYLGANSSVSDAGAADLQARLPHVAIAR
jgi:hypothetical protein